MSVASVINFLIVSILIYAWDPKLIEAEYALIFFFKHLSVPDS